MISQDSLVDDLVVEMPEAAETLGGRLDDQVAEVALLLMADRLLLTVPVSDGAKPEVARQLLEVRAPSGTVPPSATSSNSRTFVGKDADPKTWPR